MASAIPPPYVPFTPSSSSLLDVPRLGAPRPFSSSPASSIPVFVLVFCYITFLSVSVFFGFFYSFGDLLCTDFATLRPLLGFFRAPTMTSFYRALLCMGSTYMRSVFFSVFLFTCIQFYCFFFSLHFICYLLVIMLWPRWFDWILFDPDLCVVDVYVTLAFRSMRKNGPDFCVVDECVSQLNCRRG
jgi:hypothetical protein